MSGFAGAKERILVVHALSGVALLELAKDEWADARLREWAQRRIDDPEGFEELAVAVGSGRDRGEDEGIPVVRAASGETEKATGTATVPAPAAAASIKPRGRHGGRPIAADSRTRQVVEAFADWGTSAEVAERLGMTRRSVMRILHRVSGRYKVGSKPAGGWPGLIVERRMRPTGNEYRVQIPEPLMVVVAPRQRDTAGRYVDVHGHAKRAYGRIEHEMEGLVPNLPGVTRAVDYSGRVG